MKNFLDFITAHPRLLLIFALLIVAIVVLIFKQRRKNQEIEDKYKSNPELAYSRLELPKLADSMRNELFLELMGAFMCCFAVLAPLYHFASKFGDLTKDTPFENAQVISFVISLTALFGVVSLWLLRSHRKWMQILNRHKGREFTFERKHFEICRILITQHSFKSLVKPFNKWALEKPEILEFQYEEIAQIAEEAVYSSTSTHHFLVIRKNNGDKFKFAGMWAKDPKVDFEIKARFKVIIPEKCDFHQ